MADCARCREGRRPPLAITVFMSIFLLSSVTSVKSFNIKHVSGHQFTNKFCSLPMRSSHRNLYRSSQLKAALDDDISVDRLPVIADQGTPSATFSDPLSLNGVQIGSESTPITPLLTVPSVSPDTSGFNDIPSISSTASPSLDSTLSFSGQPKTQATFTLLNRISGINQKLDSSKKVKITTWDSPRFVKRFLTIRLTFLDLTDI